MKAATLVPAALGLGLSAGIVLSLVGVGAAGCHGCTGILTYGLTVTVIDGPSGARICDATVTARDGSYSEVLTAWDAQGDCVYLGAADRAGTYSIEVVAGTRSKTIENVRVTPTSDECHVMNQQETIVLDP